MFTVHKYSVILVNLLFGLLMWVQKDKHIHKPFFVVAANRCLGSGQENVVYFWSGKM